jgi:hypothetical protein
LRVQVPLPEIFIMSETPKYLEKAKATYAFHRSKLVEDASWRVSDSARALRRSIGSISEDLLISRWSRNLPQLEKLNHAYEALRMIRQKQKELDSEEIE